MCDAPPSAGDLSMDHLRTPGKDGEAALGQVLRVHLGKRWGQRGGGCNSYHPDCLLRTPKS